MQEQNNESCWKKNQKPGKLTSGHRFNHSDSGCGKCQPEVSKCLGAQGFTLLEVLVVLVLLATISAVVAPSLGRGIGTLQLQTSARQICATLRLARSKAIREHRVFFVGFDLEKNAVDLSSEDLTYQKSFELPEGIKIRGVSKPDGDPENEQPSYSYSFAPNGMSDSFELWLVNKRGRELRVVQNSFVHSPRIEEVEPERL